MELHDRINRAIIVTVLQGSHAVAPHARPLTSLIPLQALVTAADVIGVQDASALAMQNVMSMFAATRAPHTRPTSEAMFALGERAAILADVRRRSCRCLPALAAAFRCSCRPPRLAELS